MTVTCGNLSVPITMPQSARTALASAKYDPLAELLEQTAAIEETAAKVGYIV
jgi:hypothetical protein